MDIYLPNVSFPLPSRRSVNGIPPDKSDSKTCIGAKYDY